MSFFDGVVNSPSEELALCASRVDSDGYDSIISIRGRFGCVVRVVTHSVGIGLKPLYYTALWAGAATSICMLPGMRDYVESAEYQDFADKHKEEAEAVRALVENNELIERYRRETQKLPLCAVVAPISQTVQLLKAAGGIIYPGFYYQDDPFLPIFKSLSEIAIEVGCSEELVESLQNGSEILHDKLFHLTNRDYYLAIFLRDFQFVESKLKETEISLQRKQLLLNMLDPLSSKSGIKGCAPALGRILEQIRAQIDVPIDPLQAIPQLADQFKEEVINRMVMQTELASKASREDWQQVVYASAHDPSHRGNAIILAIGDKIGIANQIIERSRHDSMANRAVALRATEEEALLRGFFQLYSDSELALSLLAQINSQPDGSPGLKVVRQTIFQHLCEDLQAEAQGEDQSLEAVELYYENRGRGSPSEPGFTDLNEHALRRYVALAERAPAGGFANPFAVCQIKGFRTKGS